MESSATMESMRGDKISIIITEKLGHLLKQRSEYSICRVHDQLRMANEEAYGPEIISIGPYHRGKKNLEAMEKHKLRYLDSLLERRKESVQVFVDAIRSLEDKARRFFADLPELDTNEFLQILVIDGCFIVELLRKFHDPSLRDADDPIFKIPCKMNSLQRDLLLFENQLPFFVLLELFGRTEEQEEHESFRSLVLDFFPLGFIPGQGYLNCVDDSLYDDHTEHFLQLIHDNWLPSFAGKDLPKQEWRLVHSATELEKCGVKIEKADEDICLLDIEFKDGNIRIPPIIIEGRTECFFRNLIAYEEYSPCLSQRFVISYAKFLDCLIHSSKDVELLCRRGIIKNWLGDEKAVSKIFNNINHSVTAPGDYFHYGGIFNEVNAHCGKKENRWMANLWAKYLNGPWKVISILSAFTLLLMSFIQTIVAVLSYSHKRI